eukprot:TRINITY_DN1318_c0_g1_i2.p1 TRINITY_DN1318_c0_g1~~TRINITY_DN1318_c0_g1_i2.p1  ORF type:complete len:745 (-),score=181.09 TRINITY_DN1318_c0_g1_i2:1897-4131(-)
MVSTLGTPDRGHDGHANLEDSGGVNVVHLHQLGAIQDIILHHDPVSNPLNPDDDNNNRDDLGKMVKGRYVLDGEDPHDTVPSPSTANEQIVRTDHPLPKFQMAVVIVVQLCESFQANVLFPFVVFMVADFGVAGSEENVGYYAGALAASFFAAQLPASLLWGRISDSCGRKPTILLGLLGSIVSYIIFGMSNSYSQALLGRAFAGVLNGNIGVIKSFLAEFTDDNNRSRAFSFMPLAWGLGAVVGPLAGGILSKPAETEGMEWLAPKGGVFRTYPYLLPCLCGVVVQLFSALVTMLFMRETAKGAMISCEGLSGRVDCAYFERMDEERRTVAVEVEGADAINRFATATESEVDGLGDTGVDVDGGDGVVGNDGDDGGGGGDGADVDGDVNDDDDDGGEDDISLITGKRTRKKKSGKNKSNVKSSNDKPIQISWSPSAPSAATSPPPVSGGGGILERFRHTFTSNKTPSRQQLLDMKERAPGRYVDVDVELGHPITAGSGDDVVEENTSKPSMKAVFTNYAAMSACAHYGLVALIHIVFDEALPLFMRSSVKKGGLDFSTSQIGTVLGCGGAALFAYNLFLFPILSARFSNFACYRVGLAATVPLFLVIPFTNFILTRIGALVMWPVLVSTLILRILFASTTFVPVMVFVNNSVPTHNLGTVNGVGQACASLARAIGPALGGAIWSMSESIRQVPGHQYILFVAVAACIVATLLLSYRLPPSLESALVEEGKTSGGRRSIVMVAH